MLSRISARQWNDYLRHLGTRLPVNVQVLEPSTPAHAWKVNPQYDSTRKRWTASVRPGSVNARIATITMPFGRAPQSFQRHARLREPARTFSLTTPVAVPLDFGPQVDLAWREIGGDAGPVSVSEFGGAIQANYETVPRFFLRQGVRAPGSTTPPPAGTRRLFACDLVLRQPRPFLVNEISSFPGGLLGGSILSVNAVASLPPDVQDPPRVVAVPKFAPPAIQNSFSDIFFQRFLDEPTDELHLSTVYALSAPLGEGGSFPAFIDQSFQLMTRYYAHYNLAHATRTIPRAVTPPLTLVTGLAAGLGDTLFNFILSTQNDFAQSVLDLFNQRSLRGSFWAV